MKVWSAIFNIFAVLILIMLSFAYLNVTKVMKRDFDQARLKQAVEYSAEATFKNTLSIEDIGTDYTNLTAVNINPGDSLNMFETLMCYNYDLSVSDSNKRVISSSIAVGVLSGNDGFYITQLPIDEVAAGDCDLKWSAKVPYIYTAGNQIYALNIKAQTFASISSSGVVAVPTAVGLPSGMSMDTALQAVNSQITDAMVAEIERKNSNGNPFDFKFFLPAETTVTTGVNPMNGPGILILIQGAQYASPEPISAVSVAGYKTTNKVYVVGFTENVGGVTKQYYCYEGQMSPADIGSKYTIVNYYNNTAAACAAGYEPDFELLLRKIVRT